MRGTKFILLIFSFFMAFSGLSLLAGPTINKAEAATQACFRRTTANPQITVTGNKATATFTIPKECKSEKVTLASYQAPNGTDGKPYGEQKLFRWVTQTYQPGKHTLKVTVPNCYYQVDLARGDVINKFSKGNTYFQQDRLIDAAHGGNKSCEPPKPKPTPKPEPAKPVVTAPQQTLECTSLQADLTSQGGTVPATYRFTPTLSGNQTTNLTYNYDFGDGNTRQVNSSSVTHTYQQAGTYNVSLSITSGNMKDGSNVVCNTSVVVNQTPVVEAPPPATPAPAEPVVTEGKALPDTGPGDYAAIGFIWTFMGSILYAYRGRYEDILQTIVSKLG